jgi:hypothetical protein
MYGDAPDSWILRGPEEPCKWHDYDGEEDKCPQCVASEDFADEQAFAYLRGE